MNLIDLQYRIAEADAHCNTTMRAREALQKNNTKLYTAIVLNATDSSVNPQHYFMAACKFKTIVF